jgi:hypothetical protein
LSLHAHSPDGKEGAWIGPLPIEPGADEIDVRSRYAPGEPITASVTSPTIRTSAYVEIDDAYGRAWADILTLRSEGQGMPSTMLDAPPLPPGLYWMKASPDPPNAGDLAMGAIARPFFVAKDDAQALSFGLDAGECRAPHAMAQADATLGPCLALSPFSGLAKPQEIEGFSAQRARDAEKRARGLRIALGGLAVASVLEIMLLAQGAASARHGIASAAADGLLSRRRSALTVAIAILVAMLGFALMAAFVTRLG